MAMREASMTWRLAMGGLALLFLLLATPTTQAAFAETQEAKRELQEVAPPEQEPATVTASPEERPATVVGPAPRSPSGEPGRVDVKGYYRKDGTYVKPHTRSAPRRK